jgi:hypothetical protein
VMKGLSTPSSLRHHLVLAAGVRRHGWRRHDVNAVNSPERHVRETLAAGPFRQPMIDTVVAQP